MTKKWHEEDGVIYFSVTSDGTTGEQWIQRLESKDYWMEPEYARSVLLSPDFKPTTGVTTVVAVLKSMLFEDNDRITQKIRAEARRRTFGNPNAELACLIREKFTDEDLEAMGLWVIIAMHDPIEDSDGVPRLLGVGRRGPGRWLSACYDLSGDRWYRVDGFAFVAPPSSAEASADK